MIVIAIMEGAMVIVLLGITEVEKVGREAASEALTATTVTKTMTRPTKTASTEESPVRSRGGSECPKSVRAGTGTEIDTEMMIKTVWIGMIGIAYGVEVFMESSDL